MTYARGLETIRIGINESRAHYDKRIVETPLAWVFENAFHYERILGAHLKNGEQRKYATQLGLVNVWNKTAEPSLKHLSCTYEVKDDGGVFLYDDKPHTIMLSEMHECITEMVQAYHRITSSPRIEACIVAPINFKTQTPSDKQFMITTSQDDCFRWTSKDGQDHYLKTGNWFFSKPGLHTEFFNPITKNNYPLALVVHDCPTLAVSPEIL